MSRLLVFPGTWFSPTHLAVYLSVAGAATGALVALAVYRLSAGLIDSTVLRVALALAVALHPVLLQENLANITNVIWVLCFAVFFALLHRPENKADVALAVAVAFLGTGSTILGLVFLPVAAYVAWTRRDTATRVVLGAYGLAVVLQVVAYATASNKGTNTAGKGQLLNLYIARVLGITAVGDPGIAHLWNDGGRTFVYPVAFVVVATIAVLLACNRGWTLGLGLVAVGYSVVLFFGDLILRGDAGLPLGSRWTDGSGRYNVMSVLFLLAAIAILIPHRASGGFPEPCWPGRSWPRSSWWSRSGSTGRTGVPAAPNGSRLWWPRPRPVGPARSDSGSSPPARASHGGSSSRATSSGESGPDRRRPTAGPEPTWRLPGPSGGRCSERQPAEQRSGQVA